MMRSTKPLSTRFQGVAPVSDEQKASKELLKTSRELVEKSKRLMNEQQKTVTEIHKSLKENQKLRSKRPRV
jgi:septal ring factor EnvC (AmiA/AmiB activator)